jgi:hypothetical protein
MLGVSQEEHESVRIEPDKRLDPSRPRGAFAGGRSPLKLAQAGRSRRRPSALMRALRARLRRAAAAAAARRGGKGA